MASITDVIWLGTGSICGLLAGIHGLTWLRARENREHLLLALLAASVTVSATIELMALHATSVAEYAWAYRWTNAMVLPLVATTVLLVQVMAPGRQWLAMLVIGTRVVATIANFTTGDSAGFSEFTGLREVLMPWGETVAGPEGVVNPWNAVAQASNLLLVAFLVDTLVGLLRTAPSRERNRRIGIVAGVLAFAVWVILWFLAILLVDAPLPAVVAPGFMVVVLVLSSDLSNEQFRAASLARALEASESDLRSHEQELQIIEEAGGLATWRWIPGEGLLRLSPRGHRLLGLEPGGTLTMAAAAASIQSGTRERLLGSAAEMLAGRADEMNLEIPVSLEGGERRWIAVHGRALRDAGRLLRVQGIAFDLSGQRSIDEQFKVVFGASPLAKLLVTADGTIQLANAAAQALSGYAAHDLAGASLQRLLPGQPVDALLHRDGVARDQPADRGDELLRRADGVDIPVEVAINRTRIGKKAMAVVALVDLRERMAKDAEIATQRDMLAHLSRVAVLSELSGSLAHEINQPLTAILANAQASLRFLDRAEPNLREVSEGLGQVVDSAKRAGEVIQRMRAMLRKELPTLAPVDVEATIADVVLMIRSNLLDRAITCEVRAETGLPRVLADRVQLQQVLINLLNNASDAMVDGTDRRHLALDLARCDGGLELRVTDTGPGIPEANLQRVFEPFYSTKANGLGLGLALCRSLLEAQGGRLWASRGDDGGACFHVFLPVASPQG